jgi:hypothetical protein
MWDYIMAATFIFGGAFFYAVSTGRLNDSEANAEYWSKLREQQPILMRYGPPVLVAFGLIRLATAIAS